MNVYAVLTTMTALLVAAAVLAGSLAYRSRQRRTSRLGRLEDAVIGRQIDDLAAGTMAPTEATQLLRELRYLPAPGSREPKEPSESLTGMLSFPDNEHGTSRLGYRLFKWLLFLGFFLLTGLMGYAWWTYPTTDDATAYLPLGATLADRLTAVQELRRDWLQQVKDLGQVFVLTPVFPLLATVVGYLFGVRRSAKDRAAQQGPSYGEPPVERLPDVAATLEASEQLADLAEANRAVPEGPAEAPVRKAPARAAARSAPAAAPATIVRTDEAGTAAKRAPRRTTRRTDPA